MITAQPGQKVTLFGTSTSGGHPETVLTVKARTATKITTSDGAEWLARNGHRWGASGSWYTGLSIGDHRPEHDAVVAHRRAVRKAKDAVERIDWANLTTEGARAIAAALGPYLKAEENGK